MTDSTFTFRLDEELKTAFSALAQAQERTSAQLLRVMMRDAVAHARHVDEHDSWFRDQVEDALVQADDAGVERVRHDDVTTRWEQQRAALERRGTGQTA